MDSKELVNLIKDLDLLVSKSFDLTIVGGAAMILHFGAKRATRDIDALLLKGNYKDLEKAFLHLSESRNLPDNWLNFATKGFIDALPVDFKKRLIKLDYNLKNIQLFVLGKVDQIAMKVVALREQDLEDLDILIKNITPEEIEILIEHVERLEQIRPDWSQKIYYFILEKGWKVN